MDTFIDQYVQTGQKTSIRCIATGNPTPEIRWKLDGEILEENSDIKIGSFLNPSGDVVSYVNISNVHLHYGGEYQCISSNEVGEIHHVGQMFVYGRYNFLFNCNEINLRCFFFISMNMVFKKMFYSICFILLLLFICSSFSIEIVDCTILQHSNKPNTKPHGSMN